jgi:hypothetical protein
VRTGAVIWKRDNQAVPTTPSISASKNGTQLDFTSDGAKATFVRNPARGRVIVHETDARVISIDLKKD